MSGFKCPWCKYAGSEGLYHIRGKHPEKIDEWMRDYANKSKEKPVEEPDPFEEVEKTGIGVEHMRGRCTITRRLEFDAGHRVYMHESKCSNIHGHRYVALVTCSADKLDDLGRVIDFSVIKGLVGGWIDDELDHGMILFKDDPLFEVWRCFGFDDSLASVAESIHNQKLVDVGRQKYFVMDSNPTAENMSELIYHKATELLAPHNIRINRVRLYETPNCYADFPG